MSGRIFSGAVSVGRATIFALGLAVVLAVMFGVATTALAAVPGDPLKLGRINVVNKLTTLVKRGSGPALSLKVGSGPPLAVNSTGKVANLNADQLDGQDSAAFVPATTNAFLKNNIYKAESALNTGTALGDGTFVKAQACNSGDVLLSGGPANVSASSDMVESFPSPGSTNSWSARIQDNGAVDNFSVVVLCVNQ